MRNLKFWFCAAVLSLAVFQFSENTVDPDLWGHLVFGQQILHSGAIPKTDFYSWTAHGQPWINHEWIAEMILAIFYTAWGGPGILLLKLVVGLAAFAVCLRWARKICRGRPGLWRGVCGVGGGGNLVWLCRPAANFHGAVPRPGVAIVATDSFGKATLALALPACSWSGSTPTEASWQVLGCWAWRPEPPTVQLAWNKSRNPLATIFTDDPQAIRVKTILGLWLALIAAGAALVCNPWGVGLLRWLIGSVLWPRPQIAEWNPPPLDGEHAAFFIVLALAAFSWAFTRQKRALWELAVCAAFAYLGLRAVRNTPLFCLVALALVPPHLASALARFRQHFEHLEDLGRRADFQKFATLLFAAVSVGIGAATFTLHKVHALTMEVPRSEYPTGAVDFLREHPLHGRMLTFFDWGEMVIFDLPGCPPSMDGRLDTCYSRELIDAHWKFYNGEPFDGKVLDVDQADLALLPANLAGTAALAQRPGWMVIYHDDLAAILVPT